MKNRWRLQLVFLAVAASIAFGAALPATAATSQRDPTPIVREYDPHGAAPDLHRDTEPIIWAIIGTAAGSAALGVIYLLIWQRRRHIYRVAEPDWVAPITILRAGDSPVDVEDFGGIPQDHH